MNATRPIIVLTVSLLLAACGRDDPASLVASAKGYIAKRDFNASIIQLKNALQKEPENTEARYLLGLSFLENEDIGSAEMAFQHGEELHQASSR